MIILLGNTGYIGQAFESELSRRNWDFRGISRRNLDYTDFDLLFEFLKEVRPAFLINAAGYTGKPNVDACETDWAGTLQGNALFPATVAHACSALGIPFGHVSSGCIYSGSKIVDENGTRVEKDLMKPRLQELLGKNRPAFPGFSESDEPNFSFRNLPCSFYSGTKALGEEAIRSVGHHYIWRLRIPFDRFDTPRNYLTKVQNYPKVYENVNSLSHRGDFVNACLDLWARRAPFGTYNMTNPGFVTTRDVVGLIQKFLKPNRVFQFWKDDQEFYEVAAKSPRSNCILDVSKLRATGVRIRSVEDALVDSLKHWERAGSGG